jgi:hypothetical protein
LREKNAMATSPIAEFINTTVYPYPVENNNSGNDNGNGNLAEAPLDQPSSTVPTPKPEESRQPPTQEQVPAPVTPPTDRQITQPSTPVLPGWVNPGRSAPTTTPPPKIYNPKVANEGLRQFAEMAKVPVPANWKGTHEEMVSLATAIRVKLNRDLTTAMNPKNFNREALQTAIEAQANFVAELEKLGGPQKLNFGIDFARVQAETSKLSAQQQAPAEKNAASQQDTSNPTANNAMGSPPLAEATDAPSVNGDTTGTEPSTESAPDGTTTSTDMPTESGQTPPLLDTESIFEESEPLSP